VTWPLPGEPVPRPAHLEELLDVARRLSAGFSFVRVDLYDVEGRVVFGELTFYPEAGLGVFIPPSADRELGALWRLPGRADGRPALR
jgi:hypothetical protein